MVSPEALDWTKLLGGLGLLLFGIHNSEQTLTAVSLPSMRTFISKYVPNRFFGVGVGLGITLFTQSSSATTVLLIGLMGMQLMSLTLALAVTLGAAVGSTFAVQLLALQFTQYGPLFLAGGFGVRKLVSKYRTGWQLAGGMSMALGLIFMGLQYMIESTVGMRSSPLFVQIMEHLSSSPVYSFMVGAIFTALIHSSAATIAITMGMVASLGAAEAAAGHAAPTVVQLLPIVLGANVGTTATALMATIGGQTEAKQLAFGHTFSKLVLAVILLALLDPLQKAGLWDVWGYQGLGLGEPSNRIAAFHMVYNLVLVILWLPALGWLAQVCRSVFPPAPKADDAFKQRFLDEDSLQVPEVAIGQVRREINRMTGRLELMLEAFWRGFVKGDPETTDALRGEDDRIDRLYGDIHPYLTALNSRQLSPALSNKVLRLHYISTYLEHAGDILSRNMSRFLKKRIQEFPNLPEEEVAKLHEIHVRVERAFKYLATVLGTGDHALLKSLLDNHDEVSIFFDRCSNDSLEVIGTTKENTELATLRLDLAEEYWRYYDYVYKIAVLLQAEEAETPQNATVRVPVAPGPSGRSQYPAPAAAPSVAPAAPSAENSDD